MIFVADGAGLHCRELPGAQHGGTVVLSADHQFHGHGKHLLDIFEQLTAHVFGELHQRGALLLSGLLIHEENRLGRVRILVRVSQSTFCSDGSSDGQALQRHAIPGSALDVPGKDGFVPYQVNFAVCEALTGVNIGAARFQIIAANLLGGKRKTKENQNEQEHRCCPKSTPAIILLRLRRRIDLAKVAKLGNYFISTPSGGIEGLDTQ